MSRRPSTVIALLCAATVLLPATPASARTTAKVTISGRSHWVLYISPSQVASGYKSACDSVNGGVTLWGGTKAKVIKRIANKPVVEEHIRYASGAESWTCHMSYRVSVARKPKYAITWSNATPYENYGCTNTKTPSDARIWNQSTRSSKRSVPTIGFTYICDDSGY